MQKIILFFKKILGIKIESPNFNELPITEESPEIENVKEEVNQDNIVSRVLTPSEKLDLVHHELKKLEIY